MFNIDFAKANTKFCFSINCNANNSYLFINRNEIFKFKADNKNVKFPTQFCLGSISSGFSAIESREVVCMEMEMEMCIIFQSITTLLINLTYSQVFNDKE